MSAAAKVLDPCSASRMMWFDKEDQRALFGDIARNTLRNWELSGKLPPPVRLSDRVIGWRRSTIEALLERGCSR